MRGKGLRRFAAAVWMLGTLSAGASGPRYVTGAPFFPGKSGVPIGWKQTQLLYYTDPGGLSASVNHQAADALVAAAAAVWNLPVASITVGQGGALAEHVSGQNVYLDTTGLEFPADVMSANAAAVPIAVIYDTDGSVTDLLLGAGASDPSGCRQNAVTESVDRFDPAGYILHAMVVLNGRCTGAAPEEQIQMQYQAMRAFGRVLGMAWSQTNDNVFTGVPTPTYAQAMNWPVMHPIEILCGPYTYQCMPSPFQLRPDDIGSMVEVYPTAYGVTPAAGKQGSLASAHAATGHVYFPTGQGMAGVNVLVRREPNGGGAGFDPWYEASGVTGTGFRSGGTSPFVSRDGSPRGSFGTGDPGQIGTYLIPYVPLLDGVPWQNVLVSTEPVNALYVGGHSVGPYGLGAVTPSGSGPTPQTSFVNSAWAEAYLDFTATDGAPTCGNGEDGTASAPVQVAASGWWEGLLCGYGHASYVAATVTPRRSFTIEVTALDEQGLATEGKAMPVIGLFGPGDQGSDLPSLGVTGAAFQGRNVGTTTIGGQTTTAAGTLTTLRVGIADERGDGRPDYRYQARFFYADNVSPAQVAVAGGEITIAGMGFRAGNAVTVHGVAVRVVSWSASTIVVAVPAMTAVQAASGVAVDVAVSDLSTGASTTMTAALTFVTGQALPNAMRIVTAPPRSVYVGDAATFAVQVVAADGVTPVVGDAVVFSAAAGPVVFGACGQAMCTVRTDATGTAATSVTAQSEGAMTVQAADGGLAQTTSFTATAQAGSMLVLSAPSGSLAVGAEAQTAFFVQVYGPNGGGYLPGRAITFSVLTGAATFSGCVNSVCTVTANGNGCAKVYVTPTAAGPVTIQAADGDVKQTAAFTAVTVADTMRTTGVPASPVFVNESTGTFTVVLEHGDGSGPDWFQPIMFTAPAGFVLGPCHTNVCTVDTGWSGQARVDVSPHQTGSFTIQAAFGAVTATAHLDVIEHTSQLHIISMPEGNVPVGSVASRPFTAQLLQDGTTPMGGVAVSLQGPQHGVVLASCDFQGGAGCRLWTDGNGMVTTTVMPLAPGTISLSATYPPLTDTATFTAVGVGETMVVTQQPGPAGVWVGDVVNLEIQDIGPGGVLRPQSREITFSVTAGGFGFADCFRASCDRSIDDNGFAGVAGIATAPGIVSVLASNSVVSQTITFMAKARSDVMQLVSGPASGGYVGAVASGVFSVRLLSFDGVTPLQGRSVTVSVTNGTAALTGCGGAASCVLQTDSGGRIATQVTPLSAGTITLMASEGAAQATASFSAVDLPDTMRLLSGPASGGYVGAVAAIPFSVRVLLGDGLTPAAGKNVTVSVTNGAAGLAGCGGAPNCVLQTDAGGVISTLVTPLGAGTITLAASEGAVQQTASFTAIAVPQPDVMQVVSVPSSGGYVGTVAAAAFAVRVFLSDGVTPATGRNVTVSVTNGSASMSGCGISTSCVLQSDSAGIVSTAVTPLGAGTIVLLASEGAVQQSVSFTALAVVLPDVMRLVSAPASGGYVGTTAGMPFAVRLLLADGATAAVGKNVTISVTNGVASLAGCGGSASCSLQTDSAGLISTLVTPLGTGSITLVASEGAVQLAASFTAVAAPVVELLVVAGTPGASVYVGDTARSPMKVRVTLADGTTGVAGITVALASSAQIGAVSFGACGAATCSVITDAGGYASSLVTGTAAGAVTLTATASLPTGVQRVAMPLQVVSHVFGVSAVNGTAYVAEGAMVGIQLGVVVSEDGGPVVGQAVHWSGTQGLQSATTDTVTDSAGAAALQALLGPIAAGAIASAKACAWQTVCATFNGVGVAAKDLGITVQSGGAQSVTGGGVPAAVVAAVTDGAGHPVGGATVSIYQAVRAVGAACPDRGRCPAEPVVASRATVVVAGVDGTVSVLPMTMDGMAAETEIAFSVGTAGFVTAVIQNRP